MIYVPCCCCCHLEDSRDAVVSAGCRVAKPSARARVRWLARDLVSEHTLTGLQKVFAENSGPSASR